MKTFAEGYRRGRNGVDSKSTWGLITSTWVRIPPPPPSKFNIFDSFTYLQGNQWCHKIKGISGRSARPPNAAGLDKSSPGPSRPQTRGRCHTGREIRIQPAIPTLSLNFLQGRQLKFQSFPIGIENEGSRKPTLRILDGECQAVIFVAPVLLIQADAMEPNLQASEDLVEGLDPPDDPGMGKAAADGWQ